MNDKVTLGHVARKRFGQNFLWDKNVISNIVRAVHPVPGEALIEIGPGLGALTEPVLNETDHLSVIELDRDLAKRLREDPFLSPKLTIYEEDALKFDFNKLSSECGKKLRIFGNLPYNISTPLLLHLFSMCDVIENMHFMLQKEVVERLAAAPDSKDYGRLSVITQYYCKVIPIMEVKPTSFRPSPKVTSAVIRLVPYTDKPFPVKKVHNLEKVLATAFNQRRKTLHNSLSSLFSDEQLAEAGISPTIRAENVTPEKYSILADMLEE